MDTGCKDSKCVTLAARDTNTTQKCDITKQLLDAAAKSKIKSLLDKALLQQNRKSSVPLSSSVSDFNDSSDFKEAPKIRNKLRLKTQKSSSASSSAVSLCPSSSEVILIDEDRQPAEHSTSTTQAAGRNQSMPLNVKDEHKGDKHTGFLLLKEKSKCQTSNDVGDKFSGRTLSMEETDSEKNNVTKCPLCGEQFDSTVYKFHRLECLKSNFSHPSRAKVKSETEDEAEVKCHVCQRVITHMNTQRRAQHINQCLDKKHSEELSHQQQLETARTALLSCPMCGKKFKLPTSRLSHIKRCAVTNNMTVDQVKNLLKQQEEEHQVKLSAGILPEDFAPTKLKSLPLKQSKIPKSKRHLDEDIQLALALSSSLVGEEKNKCGAMGQVEQLSIQDLGQDVKGKGRIKKGKSNDSKSLLMTLTREEAAKRISDRVARFIFPPHDASEAAPPFKSGQKPKCSVPVEEFAKIPSCGSNLWSRTSLDVHADKSLEPDKAHDLLFYVQELIPPVSVSTVSAGSKLRRISSIPGRGRTEERDLSSAAVEKVQSVEPPWSSQTVNVLMELAMESTADDDGDQRTETRVDSQQTDGDQRTETRVDSQQTDGVQRTETWVDSQQTDGDQRTETRVDSQPTDGDQRTETRIASQLTVDSGDDLPQSGFCIRSMVLVGDYSPEVLTSYLDLVNCSRYSDVVIVAAGGARIYGHKLILHARCPNLLAMCSGDTGEDVINLTSHGEECVLGVLRYVYGGRTQLDVSSLPEVIQLADRLSLTSLKTAASNADVQPAPQEEMDVSSECEDICDPFQAEAGSMDVSDVDSQEDDDWRDIFVTQRANMKLKAELPDLVDARNSKDATHNDSFSHANLDESVLEPGVEVYDRTNIDDFPVAEELFHCDKNSGADYHGNGKNNTNREFPKDNKKSIFSNLVQVPSSGSPKCVSTVVNRCEIIDRRESRNIISETELSPKDDLLQLIQQEKQSDSFRVSTAMEAEDANLWDSSFLTDCLDPEKETEIMLDGQNVKNSQRECHTNLPAAVHNKSVSFHNEKHHKEFSFTGSFSRHCRSEDLTRNFSEVTTEDRRITTRSRLDDRKKGKIKVENTSYLRSDEIIILDDSLTADSELAFGQVTELVSENEKTAEKSIDHERQKKKKVNSKEYTSVINKVLTELSSNSDTIPSPDPKVGLTDDDIQTIRIKIEQDLSHISDPSDPVFIPNVLEDTGEKTNEVVVTFADIKTSDKPEHPLGRKRSQKKGRHMNKSSEKASQLKRLSRFTNRKQGASKIKVVPPVSLSTPEKSLYSNSCDRKVSTPCEHLQLSSQMEAVDYLHSTQLSPVTMTGCSVNILSLEPLPKLASSTRTMPSPPDPQPLLDFEDSLLMDDDFRELMNVNNTSKSSSSQPPVSDTGKTTSIQPPVSDTSKSASIKPLVNNTNKSSFSQSPVRNTSKFASNKPPVISTNKSSCSQPQPSRSSCCQSLSEHLPIVHKETTEDSLPSPTPEYMSSEELFSDYEEESQPTSSRLKAPVSTSPANSLWMFSTHSESSSRSNKPVARNIFWSLLSENDKIKNHENSPDKVISESCLSNHSHENAAIKNIHLETDEPALKVAKDILGPISNPQTRGVAHTGKKTCNEKTSEKTLTNIDFIDITDDFSSEEECEQNIKAETDTSVLTVETPFKLISQSPISSVGEDNERVLAEAELPRVLPTSVSGSQLVSGVRLANRFEANSKTSSKTSDSLETSLIETVDMCMSPLKSPTKLMPPALVPSTPKNHWQPESSQVGSPFTASPSKSFISGATKPETFMMKTKLSSPNMQVSCRNLSRVSSPNNSDNISQSELSRLLEKVKRAPATKPQLSTFSTTTTQFSPSKAEQTQSGGSKTSDAGSVILRTLQNRFLSGPNISAPFIQGSVTSQETKLRHIIEQNVASVRTRRLSQGGDDGACGCTPRKQLTQTGVPSSQDILPISPRKRLKHIIEHNVASVQPTKFLQSHYQDGTTSPPASSQVTTVTDDVCSEESPASSYLQKINPRIGQYQVDMDSPLPLRQRLGLLGSLDSVVTVDRAGSSRENVSQACSRPRASTIENNNNVRTGIAEYEPTSTIEADFVEDDFQHGLMHEELMEACLNDSSFLGQNGIISDHHLDETFEKRIPVTPLGPVKKQKSRTSWKQPSPFTPMPAYDSMATPDLKMAAAKIGVRPLGKKRMRELLKHVYHETHQYETDSDYDGTPFQNKRRSLASPQSRGVLSARAQLSHMPIRASTASVVKKTWKPAKPKTRPIQQLSSALASQEQTVTISQSMNRALGPHVKGMRNSVSEKGKSDLQGDCIQEEVDEVTTGSQDSSYSDGPDLPEESILQGWPEEDVPQGWPEDEVAPSLMTQSNSEILTNKLVQFIQSDKHVYESILMYEPLELDVLKKRIAEAGIRVNMAFVMDFLDERCITFTMKNMSSRNNNRHRRGKSKLSQISPRKGGKVQAKEKR